MMDHDLLETFSSLGVFHSGGGVGGGLSVSRITRSQKKRYEVMRTKINYGMPVCVIRGPQNNFKQSAPGGQWNRGG